MTTLLILTPQPFFTFDPERHCSPSESQHIHSQTHNMDEPLPEAHAITTPLHHTTSNVTRLPSKSLLDLPNKLLFDVLSRTPNTPRQQRDDITQLALVCQRLRLRPLAMEQLLVKPVIHTCKLWALVRTYLGYPQLTPGVRSLELLTHSTSHRWNRVETLSAEFAQHSKGTFKKTCVELIAQTELPWRRRRRFLSDLRDGHGFLAVLLTMLPSLAVLNLGTGEISEFDFLRTLYRDENARLYNHQREGVVAGY
jgi:hypothetical protein